MRQILIDRFLKYVSFETRSDENSRTIPSTKSQIDFGKKLVEELKELGLNDAKIDEFGYVTATLKSNIDKKVPTIGFIAHMDTADFNALDVKPKFVENYDGKDIILNEKEGIILSPNKFPELKNYIGKTLITTDGTTLLGADDKAGIAEIVTSIEYLIKNPNIKHGDIKVAFTPDEEIGRGADKFNVEDFGADFAYTLDGSALGELEYESFNAAAAKVTINGTNVHPGTAKGKMVNSISLANELISLFPKNETPETTEGYEGFFHLLSFQGEVDKTNLSYIIRDFDRDNFEKRKKFFTEAVDKMKEKHGEDRFILELSDQYYNMREKVEPVIEIVEIAKKAMENCDITPIIKAIRGGTDGSKLSFMGLPTPNIFAGGENFHGRYEYVAVQSMEKACDVIIEICKLFAEK